MKDNRAVEVLKNALNDRLNFYDYDDPVSDFYVEMVGKADRGLREAAANAIMNIGENLSGAELRTVIIYGTDFSGENLSGADLSGTDFSGANLKDANLDSAKYNRFTKWPDGFEPEKAGAILVE